MEGEVRFLLNGVAHTLQAPQPTRTVLQYLREEAGCTGTKEGCAEGDCGACTVVLAEPDGDSVSLKAINACIQFLPTLHGKALYTVEALSDANGPLHPVQQAMVDSHASQCGFCTPGFVMSLFALYQNQPQAERSEVADCLSGNLCRCTGYRPIFDAAQRMYQLPRETLDRRALRQQLDQLSAGESLHIERDGQHFHAPISLDELAALRQAKPQARMLAGGTDVGLWVTKQFRELGDILYLGRVAELHTVCEQDGVLQIGAAVSLNDAFAALVRHYPQLQELHQRFASTPIRNAGTLGGNVANGSPIGDAMPALIALSTEIVLRGGDHTRSLPLEDLYLAYQKNAMQPGEFVQALRIPLPDARLFRAYKLSKRFDQDISAVMCGLALQLRDGVVQAARLAFGGMAATPKRAQAAEQALVGQRWSEDSVRRAMQALATDFQPLSDMRASADYRLQAAQNLLYRFWLESSGSAPVSVLAWVKQQEASA
ncbi:xanthine dehydrogenase small subunit [Leeia sp.]|uniref:xanthine dehydrogenase small subunit n=1 Tax=Leeia sp. TaxID=2884678 RepID=UPI0035B139AD